MTRLILIAILAATTLAGVLGWRHEAIKFREYRAEVDATAKAQEKESERIKNDHDRATKEAAASYDRRIADLRAYYASRVSGRSGGGKMPSPADTSAGTHEYTPDNLPDPAILASQCAETTLMLTSLQDWVIETTKE